MNSYKNNHYTFFERVLYFERVCTILKKYYKKGNTDIDIIVDQILDIKKQLFPNKFPINIQTEKQIQLEYISYQKVEKSVVSIISGNCNNWTTGTGCFISNTINKRTDYILTCYHNNS